MEERRARINDDLRGMLGGELLFEPIERAPYAYDSGLFEIDPIGVVVPRSVEDVVLAVRYAGENGLSVHPRGAGTGTSGGAIGPGLIVDFGRYFHRIVEIQDDRVVVQPGVVLDALNAELAPLGRRIGPDPAGSAVATVGGMVALDAAGPSSLRYGSIRDHVEKLRVVFASGEVAEIGRELWPGFDDEPTDFKGVVVRKLGALVRRNMDLLVRQSARSAGVPSGFALAKAASGMGIHLPRVVVGSEGTLALVTEVTLRTVPIPAAQAAVLLPFARLNEAAASAADCLDSSPTACELFDWRLIHLAREVGAPYRDGIADTAEAVIVLLFEGDDPGEVAWRSGRVAERIARQGRLAADPVITARRAECEKLLGLRGAVEPLLMRMRGRARPATFFDEVVVAPEHLAAMIQRLQAAMSGLGLSWTLDAHAGLGRIHPRPFLDLSDPLDLAKLEPLAAAVHEAALDLGGSVAGEAGRGPVRAQYLKRSLGDLLPVFREIKDAFDPLNVLNPGRIVGDDHQPSASALRRYPPTPPSTLPITGDWPMPTAEFPEPTVLGSGSGELTAPAPEVNGAFFLPVLRWEGPGPIETASACNACGACRTSEGTSRMCPTSRAMRSEQSTPRARANLIRQLATGQVDPKLWGTEELKATADLCIHCNLCPSECPSGLDVSSLMIEAKAAYVENHGLSPSDWWISRVDLWARVASRLPILSNAVLKSKTTRWLLERLCGLSSLRRLPRLRRTPFSSRASRLGLSKARPHEPGPRVAYFVDTFANHFDQELAEAVVGVLRQAGVNVFVPPGQCDSGMPALVAGDVEHSRELALRNLRVLGNAVRDGYTVVCSEPTAALMLRREYLKLTDDLDAALVAENTREIGQYLAGLAERGQLPPPEQPLRARVGYHQPCHHRALDLGTPGLDLIRMIPDLDVEFIDRGCSGMAGTFGLHRDRFRVSLRAGRGLLSRLRDDDLELGATECSACRMQMEQSSTKRTLHPVKLLSLGYGLNPSLRRHVKDPKPRHEVI